MLCCPNEAAREDQGGVQYGGISGYKNRTPGRRGGSNLIDSTAPPIRSSNYGISRLPEESNPERRVSYRMMLNFEMKRVGGEWKIVSVGGYCAPGADYEEVEVIG